MDSCAKRGCDSKAEATAALLYGPREVVVSKLAAEPDPSLLLLCGAHADGLNPPLGWRLTDDRTPDSAAS